MILRMVARVPYIRFVLQLKFSLDILKHSKLHQTLTWCGALLYSMYQIIWNEGGLLLQSPHWIKMPETESGGQIHSPPFSEERRPLRICIICLVFPDRSRAFPSDARLFFFFFLLCMYWIVIGYLNFKEWCYTLEGERGNSSTSWPLVHRLMGRTPCRLTQRRYLVTKCLFRVV